MYLFGFGSFFMDNALYSITKLFNKKFCRLFLVKKGCKLPNGIIPWDYYKRNYNKELGKYLSKGLYIFISSASIFPYDCKESTF